jgi:hypothetical protein
MSEMNEAKEPSKAPEKTGIYIESSALAKIYVPEADSEQLDAPQRL